MGATINQVFVFDKEINLKDTYSKFKLTTSFPYKSIWQGEKKFQSIRDDIKPIYFKNTIISLYYIDNIKINIRISSKKLLITQIPITKIGVVDNLLEQKLNIKFVEKNVNMIKDSIQLPETKIVNLPKLDKKLVNMNLPSYQYQKDGVSHIRFRYFANGFVIVYMIYSTGKILVIISFDDAKVKNIPNEMRSVASDYVVNLVQPIVKSAIYILDNCGKGKLYDIKFKCKKATKKNTETLFTGIKGYFKGFNEFTKEELENCIAFRNTDTATPMTQQSQIGAQKLVGELPPLVSHFPIIQQDIKIINRRDWKIFGIELDYQRARFYIDSNGISYYIDKFNNYIPSTLPKTDEYDVIIDGYYNMKTKQFSPIDIIVYQAKILADENYKTRNFYLKNIIKKYNMYNKIVPLNKFHELELSSLIGFVFFNTKGKYYDMRFSWNEVRNTMALYIDGDIIFGSERFTGFKHPELKNGDILMITFDLQRNIKILYKMPPNTQMDDEYSFRVYNSLNFKVDNLVDIFK